MRTWRACCALLILLVIVAAPRATSRGAAPAAPYAGAAELLAQVNALRAANGLPAYRTNQTLMSIAQAHSDYQASIGDVTHTGPGGSRPRDRAAAAGYGNGGTIFISENIVGSPGMTAGEAVQAWQGDALHLNTMLGASYQDAGAGMAEANGVIYYTLDVGYVAGSEAPAPPADGTAAAAVTAPAANPTPAAVTPVYTVTPRADGSILHIVQPGQALWSIAIAYGVKVADLWALNGLNDRSVIYPGDKILVKEAPPTATPTVTLTPTRTPRPTRVTATLRPTRTPPPPGSPSSTPAAPAAKPAAPAPQDPLLVTIIALVAVGAALILFGALFRRR
jgi:LysM repeat protein